jgi:hypothetical protein
MFTTFPPKMPEQINLSKFSNFGEKVDAVVDHLKIRSIFCEVSNKENLSFTTTPARKLHVTEIIVPGGDTNYIKDILTELYEILSKELTQYVDSDESYDSITACLKTVKEKSEKGFDENNRTDQFTFKNDFNFMVYDGNVWDELLPQWLEFDHQVIYKRNDHLDLRKGFFDKLIKLFDKALQSHLTLPAPGTAVWSWDSENAELEFSEVFYVLHVLISKISIRDPKCSPSQARKILFNLFGLDDKDYKKKESQILGRKKGGHFLNELATKLSDYVAGLWDPNKKASHAKVRFPAK